MTMISAMFGSFTCSCVHSSSFRLIPLYIIIYLLNIIPVTAILSHVMQLQYCGMFVVLRVCIYVSHTCTYAYISIYICNPKYVYIYLYVYNYIYRFNIPTPRLLNARQKILGQVAPWMHAVHWCQATTTTFSMTQVVPPVVRDFQEIACLKMCSSLAGVAFMRVGYLVECWLEVSLPMGCHNIYNRSGFWR